jgi:Bacterial low temperature requirement A protein (LtrA)
MDSSVAIAKSMGTGRITGLDDNVTKMIGDEESDLSLDNVMQPTSQERNSTSTSGAPPEGAAIDHHPLHQFEANYHQHGNGPLQPQNYSNDNHPSSVALDSYSSTQVHHVNGHDQHPHEHNEGHHEEGPLVFFAPPRQRQRWGETQVAPHTNWGDIFFDLFYVAAAYNLGNVLAAEPSPTGLLYTAGLFFPIQNLWGYKTFYDSRFYVLDDVWHRGYEITLLLALATVVLHIKPVAVLSHPTQTMDMFVYCVGLCVAYFLALGRLIEIMICQRYVSASANSKETGLHPEAYHAARKDLWSFSGAGFFYVAAAIYTGIQYFEHRSMSEYRSLAASTIDSSVDYNKPNEMDNVAIWLFLGGVFINLVGSAFFKMTATRE